MRHKVIPHRCNIFVVGLYHALMEQVAGWGWLMTDPNAQLSVRIRQGAAPGSRTQLSPTQSGWGQNSFLDSVPLPYSQRQMRGCHKDGEMLPDFPISGSLYPRSLKPWRPWDQ